MLYKRKNKTKPTNYKMMKELHPWLRTKKFQEQLSLVLDDTKKTESWLHFFMNSFCSYMFLGFVVQC